MKLENLRGEVPDFRRTVVKFWPFTIENALESDQVDLNGYRPFWHTESLPNPRNLVFDSLLSFRNRLRGDTGTWSPKSAKSTLTLYTGLVDSALKFIEAKHASAGDICTFVKNPAALLWY